MKKITSNIIITFMLIIFFIPMNVNAISIDGDLSYEEGGKIYQPTFEDMLIKAKKEMKVNLHRIDDNIRRRVSPIELGNVLDVERFEQETQYWCAPASVKQVLHYVNGRSESQSYYASKLRTTTAGTDMTVIPKVLNDEIGEKIYAYDGNIKSFRRWELNILTAIKDQYPPILDIKIDKKHKEYFGYESEGHFVNIAGHQRLSNGNYLKVTDPCERTILRPAGTYPDKTTSEWVKIDHVYNCNMLHFRKAMIW